MTYGGWQPCGGRQRVGKRGEEKETSGRAFHVLTQRHSIVILFKTKNQVIAILFGRKLAPQV